MQLDDIRSTIDNIDLELKILLMERLDCSEQIADVKIAEGSTEVYRVEREASVLENLGADVDRNRRVEYLSVVRKIMETSRMRQYRIIYEANPDVFQQVEGHELADHPGSFVTVRLARENKPNALSTVLTMIGDYGFNMKRLDIVEEEPYMVVCDLTIMGDATLAPMRKLLFQLSKECRGFRITKNI